MRPEGIIKPTFIGIGGHKCASTWLSECLRYHPEVFMSSPKELHFFSYNSDRESEWYLTHFNEAERYRQRGEFSATYLQYPDAAENIFNTVGKVKIIVSLRNPVDRFISHYKHLYRLGEVGFEKLNRTNFDEVIGAHPELLERGMYSKYIHEFMDVFGMENMLILLKDEIDSHPNETVRKLYDFLEVNPDYIPPILNKKVSPGIIPRIYFLESLRVNLYSMLKKTAPSVLNFIRKMRIAEFYRTLNNKKGALGITDEIKKELESYYRQDIGDLEVLLDRSLSAWQKQPRAERVLD